MKKNKGVYYVSVMYGREPYVITDKDIVKKIKTAELLMCLFAILVGVMLIGTIVLGSLLNDATLGIIIVVSGMILLGLCICLGFHFSDKRDELIYKSPEYKAQDEARFLQEAKEQEKRRLAMAKELVEAYDILDNTSLSQEERIKLLEKYMKN